jgi:hypothetical protein
LFGCLHEESETHPGVQVACEDLGEDSDEGRLLDQLGTVCIQQLKQPLVNDPWEIAVFQECKTVKFLLLDGSRGQTTQSQVLVQIGKVRM